MRVLKGIYFWVMAFSVTFCLYVACFVQHLRDRISGTSDGRRPHSIASIWGRTIIRLTPGWRVTVEGRENLPPDGRPTVLVANHESMSDIWAIYYLGVQFRWLSKESVFRLPFVGGAMRWSRYVPILRGNRDSATKAMQESAERLRQGVSMLYFPEGTRSPDGVIKDFKTGAFRLARDERVQVVPIAIHGAGDLLPKHSWLPGQAHVRIRVLPAQPPPPVGESLDIYADATRAKIIQAHTGLKSAT